MSSYYEVRSPEYVQILPTKQVFGSGGCRDGKVRSPEYVQTLPSFTMKKVRSPECLQTLSSIAMKKSKD